MLHFSKSDEVWPITSLDRSSVVDCKWCVNVLASDVFIYLRGMFSFTVDTSSLFTMIPHDLKVELSIITVQLQASFIRKKQRAVMYKV